MLADQTPETPGAQRRCLALLSRVLPVHCHLWHRHPPFFWGKDTGIVRGSDKEVPPLALA